MERCKCICLALLLLGALAGCKNDSQYFSQEMEEVKVDVVRFDSALLSVRVDSVAQDVQRLYADYEEFMPTFVDNVLGIESSDTAYLCEVLPQFLMDTTMGFQQTNALVKERFEDISIIQHELNQGFTRMHYLFPSLPIPTVYFFVSGFNSSVFYYDNIIGVGVDMYLGSDYPFYNQAVYEYQKQTMRKECIAADVLSLYVAQNIPYTSRYNRLLENIVYRGKQMWLLSQLLPDELNYEIMGYSKEQWQWCEKYERAIWNRIMDKRDLFATDSHVLTSYVNAGPFTAEVSQESPGRLGTWVGWRIVDSYMQHNPEVSIQQLMADGDAQTILENSFYKP